MGSQDTAQGVVGCKPSDKCLILLQGRRRTKTVGAIAPTRHRGVITGQCRCAGGDAGSTTYHQRRERQQEHDVEVEEQVLQVE